MARETDPAQSSSQVRMVFVGAGEWSGPVPRLEDEWAEPPAQLQVHREDVFPSPVPISSALEIGQELLMPDQVTSPWRVTRVLHDYGRGLYYPPTIWVVLIRV